ncbi:MAG TPA: hypothetical protein V6D04_00430, partial [Candidatus Obscuribacterales bacterium]
TVEMTPEEQDVFALMGISPLVLSSREVKDPKSAIIQVTLPGQAPPPPPISSSVSATENGGAPPSEFVAPRTPEPRLAPPVKNTATAVLETAPPVTAATVEDVAEVAPVETTPAEATPTPVAEPEDNLGPARRRRRRSSAPSTEDS